MVRDYRIRGKRISLNPFVYNNHLEREGERERERGRERQKERE